MKALGPINVTEDLAESLKRMEAALLHFETLVPAPRQVPMLNHFVFRYVEQSIKQAILQKLVRVITGLKSAQILLNYGFFQEQSAIHRMLDEFEQDILFLSLAILDDEITDLHKRYLEAFYEEELDNPSKPIASKQKRAMIPRQKIHAYIARAQAEVNDPSKGVELSRTLTKAYSGYIHGASPHIMHLYGGSPSQFHVSGMLGTPHEQSYRDDLWNYFYRGLLSFELAANVFEELKLARDLNIFSQIMAKNAGKDYSAK